MNNSPTRHCNRRQNNSRTRFLNNSLRCPRRLQFSHRTGTSCINAGIQRARLNRLKSGIIVIPHINSAGIFYGIRTSSNFESDQRSQQISAAEPLINTGTVLHLSGINMTQIHRSISR